MINSQTWFSPLTTNTLRCGRKSLKQVVQDRVKKKLMIGYGHMDLARMLVLVFHVLHFTCFDIYLSLPLYCTELMFIPHCILLFEWKKNYNVLFEKISFVILMYADLIIYVSIKYYGQFSCGVIKTVNFTNNRKTGVCTSVLT
jgi:hypothetical protein